MVLFIVPFIYIQRSQQKGRQRLLKSFLALAGQQQLRISQHDVWNRRFAIGIDTDQSKLFYLKKQGEEDQTALIDLAQVESCEVGNINRETNGNRVVDRIELHLAFRHARRPHQAIEFYDRAESLSLNEELRLAEKWRAVVDASLQPPPPQSAKAKPNRVA